MEKIRLIAVVGPTASGKTALAVELAKKYGGDDDSAFINGVLGGLARSGLVAGGEADKQPDGDKQPVGDKLPNGDAP